MSAALFIALVALAQVPLPDQVADLAAVNALPCSIFENNSRELITADTATRYRCWDPNDTAFGWATVNASSGSAFATVDGVSFAQTTDGIQAALDSLPVSGGTVILADGDYLGCASAIVVPGNDITVQSFGNATIDCSAGQSAPAVIDLAGHDFLTLSGFRIIGNAGGGVNSDLVGSSSQVTDSTFKNLTLVDSDRNGIMLSGAAERIKIIGSTIEGNDDNGLQCVSGFQFVIDDNRFSGAQGGKSAVAGALLSDSSISGNFFSDSSLAVTVTGSRVVIESNNVDQGAIVVGGSGHRIEHNEITVRGANGAAGISAATTLSESGIHGNVISGSPSFDQCGIDLLNSSADNVVSGNILTDLTTGAGLGAIHTTNGSNSIVANTSTGNTIFLDNDGPAEQAVIMADAGNVGVGTSVPDFTLEVVPAFAVSSTEGALGDLFEIGGTPTARLWGELVGAVLEVRENGGALAIEVNNAGVVAHPRNIGASPPATCTPGTRFTDLDAADDTNCITALDNSICLCILVDTWVKAN